VRFAGEIPLEVGLTVEFVIGWPALLDGYIRLQLRGIGTVVRTNGNETVVKIEKHVFKTRRVPASEEP
jgi:hypothetical protein